MCNVNTPPTNPMCSMCNVKFPSGGVVSMCNINTPPTNPMCSMCNVKFPSGGGGVYV